MITPLEPFETFSIDFVGPFSDTSKGNKAILALVDQATRWAELVPVPNQSADTVIRVPPRAGPVLGERMWPAPPSMHSYTKLSNLLSTPFWITVTVDLPDSSDGTSQDSLEAVRNTARPPYLRPNRHDRSSVRWKFSPSMVTCPLIWATPMDGFSALTIGARSKMYLVPLVVKSAP